MEKIAIVGCGAYMDSGYGCAGENDKNSLFKAKKLWLLMLYDGWG